MRLQTSLILCLLAITVSGCTTMSPTTGPVSRPAEIPSDLRELCRVHDVDWYVDNVTQVVSVSEGGRFATAMIGSDIVMLDSQKFVLSKPLRYDGGVVHVPPDFLNIIMDIKSPGERRTTFRTTKVNTIVIDAGHGGKDPGAIGHSGKYEKEIALDIAKRLASQLRKMGYKVVMTRTKDEYLTLAERTQIASDAKADLFISVHANAHGQRNVHGMEVYTAKNLDYNDLREDQRRINHKRLYKKMNMMQGDRDLDRIIGDMLYVHKQAESKSIAESVVDITSGSVKAKNLGQKDSRFYVLRNTLVPAILVEAGFMSNPREEKLLKRDEYRARIAYGIAQGIEDYLNAR